MFSDNECMLILTILVNITVNVIAPSPQMVQESITLQCDVATFRGIESSVNLVWRKDSDELDRLNNATATVTNDSLTYTYSYTTSPLDTSYHGRVIQCLVEINMVMASDSIELNMIGKYLIYLSCIH